MHSDKTSLKRPLGKLRRYVRMDLKEVGCEGGLGMELAQHHAQR